jgi:hypothetical protein
MPISPENIFYAIIIGSKQKMRERVTVRQDKDLEFLRIVTEFFA